MTHKKTSMQVYPHSSIILYFLDILGLFIFFYLGFLSLDIHESQDSRGNGSPIVILFYHNPIYEHWDISRAIAAESPRLSDPTLSWNFSLLIASRSKKI